MYTVQSLETCNLEKKTSSASDIFGSPAADISQKSPCSSSELEEQDGLSTSSSSEWDFLRAPGALQASKELVLRMECLSPWELKVRNTANALAEIL